MPHNEPPPKPKQKGQIATVDDLVPYVDAIVRYFNGGVAAHYDAAVKSVNGLPWGDLPEKIPGDHPFSQWCIAGALLDKTPQRGIPESDVGEHVRELASKDGWDFLKDMVPLAIRKAKEDGLVATQPETWIDAGGDTRRENVLVLRRQEARAADDPTDASNSDSPEADNTSPSIEGFRHADWLWHKHGIAAPRLSEAARDGKVRSVQAPRGTIDSQGRTVRMLYNEADAVKHCLPKRVIPKPDAKRAWVIRNCLRTQENLPAWPAGITAIP